MRTSEQQPAKIATPGQWAQRTCLGGVVVLVVWFYAWSASLVPVWHNRVSANLYYNLLVDGFRAGQLNLKKEAPPGLIRLADPYDPAANLRYRSEPHGLHDASYYRGKLYLYFGITPALLLFWPWVALTGRYLSHQQAVVIFCSAGFLASAGLLRALARRYFPEVGTLVLAAGLLALGLTTSVPVMLQRPDVWEVPISCAYALRMLTLGAIWCALHAPARRSWWLAAASLAYGLAVGARPSLLFGAAILLLPVALAAKVPPENGAARRLPNLLVAAIVPLLLAGLGLMLYNYLRFGSPFEFGQHYQLAADVQKSAQPFSPRYLWFNFKTYFLEPARWIRTFPFVQNCPTAGPLPPGYVRVEDVFGILPNVPLVGLAAAAPLVWGGRTARTRATLRLFMGAIVLLFGLNALIIGLFYGAGSRYQVDILPELVLLAIVGIFGLERALATRPVWRCAARWGWGALLVCSVAINLLISVEHYRKNLILSGYALAQRNEVPEAIRDFNLALRINPDSAETHMELGLALVQTNRPAEAMKHYEEALRIQPDSAEIHYNYGIALTETGRLAEAIGHYQQALRLKPDFADAHNNLGIILAKVGRLAEAIGHYQQALQFKPNLADAHNNAGTALAQLGRLPEAKQQFEQALRLKPNFAAARANLARLRALEQQSGSGD